MVHPTCTQNKEGFTKAMEEVIFMSLCGKAWNQSENYSSKVRVLGVGRLCRRRCSNLQLCKWLHPSRAQRFLWTTLAVQDPSSSAQWPLPSFRSAVCLVSPGFLLLHGSKAPIFQPTP